MPTSHSALIQSMFNRREARRVQRFRHGPRQPITRQDLLWVGHHRPCMGHASLVQCCYKYGRRRMHDLMHAHRSYTQTIKHGSSCRSSRPFDPFGKAIETQDPKKWQRSAFRFSYCSAQ